MLGYIVIEGRGEGDRLLQTVAERLRADGVTMAGAVQFNDERDPTLKCHMDLHILSGTEVVRISQDLGRESKGCRLDASGLETAAGLVAAALANGPQVMIVNKFGKQEIEGRGFRPLIGEALGADIPVLLSVHRDVLAKFLDFAGELADELPKDPDAIAAWCKDPVGGISAA